MTLEFLVDLALGFIAIILLKNNIARDRQKPYILSQEEVKTLDK